MALHLSKKIPHLLERPDPTIKRSRTGSGNSESKVTENYFQTLLNKTSIFERLSQATEVKHKAKNEEEFCEELGELTEEEIQCIITEAIRELGITELKDGDLERIINLVTRKLAGRIGGKYIPTLVRRRLALCL